MERETISLELILTIFFLSVITGNIGNGNMKSVWILSGLIIGIIYNKEMKSTIVKEILTAFGIILFSVAIFDVILNEQILNDYEEFLEVPYLLIIILEFFINTILVYSTVVITLGIKSMDWGKS